MGGYGIWELRYARLKYWDVFFFFLLKVIFGDVFGVRGNCSTSVFFLVLFVVWVGCGKLVRVK